ncbi:MULTISPECIES: hypothetical protein [unclassified Solwaraspora]|uniref:hypothetical protein n=1 Tax=unclassified Solwaraspora TaxID=2627926 RepID=UPI00259B243C|nr:hypothetical protein [Solwaraspora sp. WMMA2056]WJK40665.1 hypothetical protein O7608_30475 [Solwaraspora sp. WMMA2056]
MQEHRRYAVRFALVSLVLALATAGCAGTGTGNPQPAPEEGTTMEPAPEASADALGCGQPLRIPDDAALTVDGQFPSTVSGTDRDVTGTVEVTSHRAVRGVVSPRAEVFLVQQGRIAAVPVAQDLMGVQWDLAAGDVEQLPGDVPLVSCEPAGGPVPAGDYELYARVAIAPDDGTERLVSYGGPWPLQVT